MMSINTWLLGLSLAAGLYGFAAQHDDVGSVASVPHDEMRSTAASGGAAPGASVAHRASCPGQPHEGDQWRSVLSSPRPEARRGQPRQLRRFGPHR